MLMGFHLTTLQHEGELNPRNPYNDEHWAFPPVIILRTLSDEADVIKRVNSTWAALTDQVGVLLRRLVVLCCCTHLYDGAAQEAYRENPILCAMPCMAPLSHLSDNLGTDNQETFYFKGK